MPEQKKAVVPRLRFPEFRDAGPWEVKRLGDVCSTYSGGTPSSSHKEYYGGNIPFIRSAEIDSEVTELHITEAGLLNSSAKLVRKGDILIALYGANSGEAAIARIDGAINQAILCLRSQFNHHYILNYWLLMKHIIILRYLQGGQGNLSGEIVRSIEMPFPTPSEQQKIADCLSSLDELIELQAKQLEALKAHKKGLMQQLFPREGETTPRLRFPEFRDAGPWEVKRLGDVCEVNPASPDLPDDFIYIDLESVESGMLLRKNRVKRDNAPIRAQRLLNQGDILYQTVRPYQRNNLLFTIDDGEEYVASTGYAQLRAYESGRFLFQLLHTDAFVYQVLARCTGTNYPAINSSDLEIISVPFPSLCEQQKIADCLSSLDELIELQAKQLEALQTHKKGLMQQLFPQEIDL